MEQKRKIIVLSSLLAALVLLFIFGTVFRTDKRYKNIYEIQLFSRIDRNAIHSIEFRNAEQSSFLVRDEGAWKIAIDESLYPADTKKVNEFLEKLLELKTQRFVTDNENRYPDFELSPEQRSIVLFTEEGEPFEEILVGKGENSQMEYVKASGSKKVFEVKNIFGFYINQNGPYWSDLQVFPDKLKEKEIVKIDIFADNILLKKESGPLSADFSLYKATAENGNLVWKLEGGENAAIRHAAVTSLINAFTGLRAEKFNTSGKSSSGKRIAAAEVTTGDNSVYRLVVKSRLDDTSFLCTRASEEFYYSVKNWNLERIFKTVEDLSGL